jgi:pimeloyl-ACP methyl ester carboxylesterase
VEFRNGDVILRGSVTVPSAAGRHSAVVLLGGDASWTAYATYFATLTDSFVSAGFAVLKYDHRGDGASGGSYPAPFTDLAGDALAGVHLLQGRSDIDPRRVGIWGHSQGGWIGPLAASQSPDVAFVIMASGSGVSVLETTLFRDGIQYRKRGASDEDVARISAIKRIVDRYYGTLVGYDAAKQALDSVRGQAWLALGNWPELTSTYELYSPDVVRANADAFRFFVEAMYEPGPALEKLTVPVLALFGAQDEVVPVDTTITILRSIFARTGNPNLTTRVYANANHAIMVGGDFAPGYIPFTRDWLAALRLP